MILWVTHSIILNMKKKVFKTTAVGLGLIAKLIMVYLNRLDAFLPSQTNLYGAVIKISSLNNSAELIPGPRSTWVTDTLNYAQIFKKKEPSQEKGRAPVSYTHLDVYKRQ